MILNFLTRKITIQKLWMPWRKISEEKDIETQIYNLFSEYFDLDPGYIKFVQLNFGAISRNILKRFLDFKPIMLLEIRAFEGYKFLSGFCIDNTSTINNNWNSEHTLQLLIWKNRIDDIFQILIRSAIKTSLRKTYQNLTLLFTWLLMRM